MIMLLAIAATVAGQSPVDRVMSICEEDLARFEVEFEDAMSDKESPADGYTRFWATGDRSLLIRTQRRADAFDARAKQLRRSAGLAAGFNSRQMEELELVCGRMTISWLEGYNRALSRAVVVTNTP